MMKPVVRFNTAAWCRVVTVAAGGGGSASGPERSQGLSEATEEPDNRAVDLERGELLSFACQACHTLGPGEADHIGPNLFSVFGRAAGAAPGFEYSDALARSGLTWTVDALDAWLAGPDEFLVGNIMVFAGYDEAADRRDLIAYLVVATSAEAQE